MHLHAAAVHYCVLWLAKEMVTHTLQHTFAVALFRYVHTV